MKGYILYSTYKTPIGEFIIGVMNDRLCLLDYVNRGNNASRTRKTIDKRLTSLLNADMCELDEKTSNPLIVKTKQQLDEYLQGQRKTFDLPLLTAGTEFQKQVWQALQNIPYGETCSYGMLAKKLNNEKAVRAVAGANGANAISIVIPCHRVIGSNGSLGGYAGGLDVKKALLALESGSEKLIL